MCAVVLARPDEKMAPTAVNVKGETCLSPRNAEMMSYSGSPARRWTAGISSGITPPSDQSQSSVRKEKKK